MRLRRRTEPPPLASGAEIAPGYEVIGHLRRGNDLDVYDAWSSERGARCVVKAIRPDRLDRRRTREALVREGDLLVRLTHPHIVRGYESLTEPVPAVVTETLTGATLSRLIADSPPPSTASLAQLGLQLGSAVRYLHRNGYLHLDLKPSNVIAEAGRAKLIDLSLARPPGEHDAGIGTWHYLSPEQARGGVLTEAADVWGLGAVLFEAAAGEAPFDDDPDAWTDSSVEDEDDEPERYPQLERRARPVAELRPVDPALAAVIDACLEPEPERRPDLVALMAALEPFAELPKAERRWARYAGSR
jgi:serine/threonine protein kinase